MKGVKRVVMLAASPPTSRVRVDTTLSLAVKPVMRAVEARQSLNPKGPKRGAKIPPSAASKLSPGVATTFRRASNVCRNQMMMEARKMTVKAFCKKPLAFSQIRCPTLLALGRR